MPNENGTGALGYLPHGGGQADNYREAATLAHEIAARTRMSGVVEEEKPRPWIKRAVYTQAYNSTANAPSGKDDGIETNYGRVWAEVRSFTASAGAAAPTVTLIGSQNGVRAMIDAGAGVTVAGGSVRFWVQDPQTYQWSLGGVEEALPTGAQRVATTDQFVTVGAR